MPETSSGLTLFKRFHESLLEQYLDLERQKLSREEIDGRLTEVARGILQEHDTSALIAGEMPLNEEERRDFYASVRGLMGGGSLAPLLDRPDVENIHVLGHDKVILSLANGDRIPGPPVAGSEEELVMMIRHLASTAGHTSRRFDTSAPILDLRLASGHRLFAITSVAEQTSVVIRRHRMLQSSMEILEKAGTVSPQAREVLRAAIHPPNPANLLVVGGTGAGKTTLLRSLLSEVPQHEFLVTIEDTLELHLQSSGLHERTLALETRTSNTEGKGEIAMYDLAKAALRMSPDRVIVGEVRGGEVMQLLQAMGIGNDGSLGTIHAGSTRAAINKILIYAQRSPDAPTPDSVLREIAEVLHMLVYIKKLPDGRRAITSIREVTGYEDGKVLTSEVFAPGADGTAVYARPFKSDGETLARLVASGFDPTSLGEPLFSSSSSPPPQPQVAPPPPSAPAPQPQAAPQPQVYRPSMPPQQPAQPAPAQPQQPAAVQRPAAYPPMHLPVQHPQPQPSAQPAAAQFLPDAQPQPSPQPAPAAHPAASAHLQPAPAPQPAPPPSSPASDARRSAPAPAARPPQLSRLRSASGEARR